MQYTDAKSLREAERAGCRWRTPEGPCLGHGDPFCLRHLQEPQLQEWAEGIRTAAYRAGRDSMRAGPPARPVPRPGPVVRRADNRLTRLTADELRIHDYLLRGNK